MAQDYGWVTFLVWNPEKWSGRVIAVDCATRHDFSFLINPSGKYRNELAIKKGAIT